MQSDPASVTAVVKHTTNTDLRLTVDKPAACPDQSHWHLEEMQILENDSASPAPRCSVEVIVLEYNGSPARNIDVLVFSSILCRVVSTDENGSASLPVFDPVEPEMQEGNNIATILEEPADAVIGIGTLKNHNTTIRLVFRRINGRIADLHWQVKMVAERGYAVNLALDQSQTIGVN